MFSMPECGIGLFPDVGASHFFQRLPAGLGLLLALSGLRLRGRELLWAGLATHFVRSERLPALEAALAAPARHAPTPPHCPPPAPSHSDSTIDLQTINSLITSFQEVHLSLPPPLLARTCIPHMHAVTCLGRLHVHSLALLLKTLQPAGSACTVVRRHVDILTVVRRHAPSWTVCGA